MSFIGSTRMSCWSWRKWVAYVWSPSLIRRRYCVWEVIDIDRYRFIRSILIILILSSLSWMVSGSILIACGLACRRGRSDWRFQFSDVFLTWFRWFRSGCHMFEKLRQEVTALWEGPASRLTVTGECGDQIFGSQLLEAVQHVIWVMWMVHGMLLPAYLL